MKRSDNSSESPADTESLQRLAREFGIEFISAIADDMLDPGLVADLPVEWARSNCLLPARIGGHTSVLTDDPRNISEQEYLRLMTGEELRPVLAPREAILRGIERCYYRRDDTPGGFMKEMGVSDAEPSVRDANSYDLLQVAEQAPVATLVNLLLLNAVKRGASDIHFEPFESKLRVRYRVDGVLYEQESPPKHLEDALVSRLKVMAHMDIAEKRLPQDGMARVRVGEREIDIRVSTVPVAEGERVVLRLLDRDSALLPLQALGMLDAVRKSFETLLAHPNGMIVVSGPTGSGKTTTLYAALGLLDAARKNIMTIEDPIEYQLPNIGQIQVKPKINLTFADGLRHILRQDPDIVLVGETRDMETAEIALRASLTGHLVFTTLHTNDAPGAVTRLVDMGVEPYLLASCLRGVLAQRLVRKLCVVCRREEIAVLPESTPAFMVTRLEGKRVYVPVGCPACLEGYKGRSGLFELMLVDSAVQDRIRLGHAGSSDIRMMAEKGGMISLAQDGVNRILDGTTCLSEVLGVAELAAGQN